MVMRRLVGVAMAFLVAGAVGTVHARGISYSYADAVYVNTRGGDQTFDSQSLSVRGSFGVHDNVHLIAGVERGRLDDDDPFGESVDTTNFAVGIGGNYDVHKKISLFLDLGYMDFKLNGNNTTRYDNGYFGEFGARIIVAKPLEFDLATQRITGSIEETFYRLQAIYTFTKRFGATAGFRGAVADGGDPKQYSVGLRFNF